MPASLAADDAVSQVLQARDERQVRQMLVHTANELKSSQAHAATLEADALATRRTELQRALWLPEMSDVSFSLRSASGAILAGVKLPRAGGSALGGPRARPLSVCRRLPSPRIDERQRPVHGDRRRAPMGRGAERGRRDAPGDVRAAVFRSEARAAEYEL